MAVKHIHTYLVHPGKGEQDVPRIGGTTVPLDGSKLFSLLENIYSRSDVECDIDISFNPNAVRISTEGKVVSEKLRKAQ